MGSRILGLLAILGGVALAGVLGIFVSQSLSAPTVRPWEVVTDPLLESIMAIAGTGGIVALGVATAGLVFAFQDRISNGGALAGSIGSVGGIFGLLGAYAALLLLPVGSAILVLDLARARVLDRWLAVVHVASAVGFAVLIAASGSNTSLGAAAVLGLGYPLTWLAIGASVIRGLPAGPVASGPRSKEAGSWDA
jgi:hypothetical protein